MMAALRDALVRYDGRAITLLGEAEAAFGETAGYHDALIALLGDREGQIANGASWLLKAALEQGLALSAQQARTLCEALGQAPDWATQLHLCQSIQHITVPPACAVQTADALTPLLQHARPFLRAWALDALCRVALDHPELGPLAHDALAAAQMDAAASVKARARKLAVMLEKAG